MKSEKLMNHIGEIDNNIIAEAETSDLQAYTKMKFTMPKRKSMMAACIILAFIFTSIANLVFSHRGAEIIEAPLPGKSFSNISEIPVEKIGNNYLDGCNDGPVEVFTMGGKFYFSKVTRWVGNDEKEETVCYYTLFNYEPETGVCTEVSDEVSYINKIDDRFVYCRSDEYLTAENQWNYQYYSNNAQWNDEQEIDAEDVLNPKEDPEMEEYLNRIKSRLSERFELDIIEFDILGILGNKLFIYGDDVTRDIHSAAIADTIADIITHNIYSDDAIPDIHCDDIIDPQYRRCLYRVNLDDRTLTETIVEIAYAIGNYVYIGEDEFIYATSATTPSKLIKIDPLSYDAICIAEVKDFVWQYVVSGDYAVCITSVESAAGTTITSVKLE